VITIRNTQRKIALNVQALACDAQFILDTLNYHDYDLGIWITNNKTIREYNRDYRHKDKPTDILSFPYYPDLKPGERIKPLSSEDKNLGDLIISAEYVARDAARYNISFHDRLRLLLVHGICHLLGYDHIEDADYRRMRAKEAFLLKKLREYTGQTVSDGSIYRCPPDSEHTD
jgi:probable rRNA maturation factor